MASVGDLVRIGVDILALAGTGTLCVVLWRRRSEPTARPLFGMATVLFVGTLVHLGLTDLGAVSAGVSAVAGTTPTDGIWRLWTYDVASLAMWLWFLFTLRYTGRTGRGARVTAGTAGVVSLFVVSATAWALATGAAGAEALHTVLWVATLTTTSVAFLGVFFLLAESAGESALPFRGSLVLSAGAVVLSLVPLAVTTFPDPVAAAATYLGASALFAAAVVAYPTFERLPAARVVGRDRVVDGIDEALVVVDRDGAVRDTNPAAERVFDIDEGAAIGRPLSTVAPSVPDPASVAAADGAVQVQTGTGLALDVTAELVTDARGRLAGHLLVCRDVTARRNRERRLSVLNQFLVGTVREEMTNVADDAAGVEDLDTDPAAVGERIRSRTTDLVTLVTHAREIERSLSEVDDRHGPTDAAAAVRGAAADLGEDGFDVTVEATGNPVYAGIPATLIREVVELLVDDHRTQGHDGTAVAVTLAVADADPAPRLRLVWPPTGSSLGADDQRGDLSIRMVRAVVEHQGGSVSVSTADDGGRRVVVELPPADPGVASPTERSGPATGEASGGVNGVSGGS